MAAATMSASTTRLAGKVSIAAKSQQPSARPAPRGARLACSAQKEDRPQLPNMLAAAALAAAVSLGTVDAAQADVSGLTKCSESKQFAKRQKNELKALDKRLKLYEEGSAPALALQATKQRTERRFANYGGQGLLCGTDGLPHLIADPGLALRYGHANEVFVPTFAFLYIAGWIGYVGRDYLNRIKTMKDPTAKEIIIDVPLAIKCSLGGVGWPAKAIAELRNGTLLESDKNITVSPR
eukprot:CAMPEP_0206137584 /NCGR_PEP_ID=MMETSP1473-20131121/2680_1 /ASSEMBLY_ACC=CAM_ASM_001109 /TAXON_ID=1461547 /ORGANISM="Stichococcus sp, Strain RCC1054" /LENGTH=237 /DNA_ID=CAMNT_0053530737 /DNA_START=75 /DNA_END=788 /DNA_ORIENTATION=+